MPRLDPINCIVWCGMGLVLILFWLWLGLLLWPTVEAALSAAGTLNDCQALSLGAADCTAFAQEAR